MMRQNTSGFKIPIITSTTAPTSGDEASGAYLGYIWYEIDTEKIKTLSEDATNTPYIRELA